MKRILCLCFSCLLLLSLLCGCGQESNKEDPSQTVEVTDGIGRTVLVNPGSYTRVVCIGAGALRMFTYIGVVSALAGVEDIDNLTLTNRPKMFDSVIRPYVLAYGETFQTLPSCGVGGPNAQTAESEKILSCNPDLIISEYEDVEKADALQEQVGVPVITLRTGPEGVFGEEFNTSMTLLGKVLGKEEKAATLLSFVQAEIQEIQRRTKDIPESQQVTAYVCGLGNWGTTNHLMTSGSFKALEIANIKNALAGKLPNGTQKIEEETFVAIGQEVDVMIIDAAAIKNIAPLYKENPTMFDTVKAWKDRKTYLELAYNAYYTNFEISLANAWYIAKVSYPEQFQDVDISAKCQDIFKAFLGTELPVETTGGKMGYQAITSAYFN